MLAQLEPPEFGLAEKLVARFEKGSRQWLRNRRFALIIPILLIGFAAFCFWFLDRTDPESHLSWMREGQVLDADMVRSYVDSRLRALRSEMFLFFVGVVSVGAAVAILIACLARWNRHLRDALIAKVLRAELQGQRSPAGVIT